MLMICQVSQTTRKKGWTACMISLSMAKKLISKMAKKARDRTKIEFGNRIRPQFQKRKTLHY